MEEIEILVINKLAVRVLVVLRSKALYAFLLLKVKQCNDELFASHKYDCLRVAFGEANCKEDVVRQWLFGHVDCSGFVLIVNSQLVLIVIVDKKLMPVAIFEVYYLLTCFNYNLVLPVLRIILTIIKAREVVDSRGFIFQLSYEVMVVECFQLTVDVSELSFELDVRLLLAPRDAHPVLRQLQPVERLILQDYKHVLLIIIVQYSQDVHNLRWEVHVVHPLLRDHVVDGEYVAVGYHVGEAAEDHVAEDLDELLQTLELKQLPLLCLDLPLIFGKLKRNASNEVMAIDFVDVWGLVRSRPLDAPDEPE